MVKRTVAITTVDSLLKIPVARYEDGDNDDWSYATNLSHSNALTSLYESPFDSFDDIVRQGEYSNDDDVHDLKSAEERLEYCPDCSSIMVFSVNGSRILCKQPHCGYTRSIYDNTIASLSYGEEYELQTTSNNVMGYARQNKARIFGRLSKRSIRQEIINYIQKCIVVSLGKTDTSSILVEDINATCKIHRWKNLSDNITQIFCRITGRAPPYLDDERTNQADNMYLLVRDTYYTFCRPKNRVNFMNYRYLWYKIWELLGAIHLLPFVQLLESAKLFAQDVIWHSICKRLNWKFIPTVARPKSVIQPLDMSFLEKCKIYSTPTTNTNSSDSITMMDSIKSETDAIIMNDIAVPINNAKKRKQISRDTSVMMPPAAKTVRVM